MQVALQFVPSHSDYYDPCRPSVRIVPGRVNLSSYVLFRSGVSGLMCLSGCRGMEQVDGDARVSVAAQLLSQEGA